MSGQRVRWTMERGREATAARGGRVERAASLCAASSIPSHELRAIAITVVNQSRRVAQRGNQCSAHPRRRACPPRSFASHSPALAPAVGARGTLDGAWGRGQCFIVVHSASCCRACAVSSAQEECEIEKRTTTTVLCRPTLAAVPCSAYPVNPSIQRDLNPARAHHDSDSTHRTHRG